MCTDSNKQAQGHLNAQTLDTTLDYAEHNTCIPVDTRPIGVSVCQQIPKVQHVLHSIPQANFILPCDTHWNIVYLHSLWSEC